MNEYEVSEMWATVGARTDIDAAVPLVILNTNRANEKRSVVLKMTPATARKVARRLNKWAKLVSEVR